MTCKLAPNGKTSTVFSELQKNFGADFAADAYITTNSKGFREWFGDWRNMADQLVFESKDSMAAMYKRRSFKLDKITNPVTNEPKLYYTDFAPYDLRADLDEVIADVQPDSFMTLQDNYEPGMTPIFVRNNNPVKATSRNINKPTDFKSKFIKLGDGKFVLTDTSDAALARSGQPVPFYTGADRAQRDQQFITNVVDSMFTAPYMKEGNARVWFEGPMKVDLSQFNLSDNFIEQVIPFYVNEIAENNPMKFENLVTELVSAKAKDNARVVLGLENDFDLNRSALNSELTKKIQNKNNKNPRVTSILQEIILMAGKINTGLPLNVGKSSTFGTIKEEVENGVQALAAINPDQLVEYGQNSTIVQNTDAYELFQNEQPLGDDVYQSSANNRGTAETTLDTESAKIAFDDSLMTSEDGSLLINPFTRRPMLSHDYRFSETGIQIHKSVTGLKKELPNTEFDQESFFLDRYLADELEVIKAANGGTLKVGDKILAPYKLLFEEYKTETKNGKPVKVLDVEATNEKKKELIKALMEGDLKKYLKKYPIRNELDKFKPKFPQRTETHINPGSYVETTNEAGDRIWKQVKLKQDLDIQKETTMEWEDRVSNEVFSILDQLWDNMMDEKSKWAMTAFIGTKFHRIAEAVMREEHDRMKLKDSQDMDYVYHKKQMVSKYDNDMEILRKLENLPSLMKDMHQAIEALEKQYAGVVTPSDKTLSPKERLESLRRQQKKVYAQAELDFDESTETVIGQNMGSTSDQNEEHPFLLAVKSIENKVDHLQRHIQLYEDLKSIKAHIKARGGIIKTEVNLYNENVFSEGEMTTVAGQADIVVIYEDAEGVDPDYRGSFEIYDYKTMTEELKASSPTSFTKRLDKTKKHHVIKGLRPQKQMEYAAQQVIYARMLEEMLGLRFHGGYIIPVTNPVVKMNGKMGGKFGIIPTQFHKQEGDHPLVLNIATFKGAEVWQYGKKVKYKGYNALRKWSFEKIPSNNQGPTGSIEGNINLGKEIVAEKNKERKNDAVLKLVDDISIYIQKQIQTAEARMKDKKKAKSERTRLNTLRTQLEEYKELDRLWRFALDATETILGKTAADNTVITKPLADIVSESIAGYHAALAAGGDSMEALRTAINKSDEIRRVVQDYKGLLNRIRNAFDQSEYDGWQAEDPDYQRINEAIAAINEIEENYAAQAKEMMVDRIMAHQSGTMGFNISEHFDPKLERLESRIDEIQKGDTSGKIKSAKLKALQDELDKLKKQKEEMITTRKDLIREFDVIENDISWVQRWALAPIASSDNVLALYAKMVKSNIRGAEIKLQEKGVEFQTFFEDLMKKLGKDPNNKTLTAHSLDAETFFDPILETRHIWVTEKDKDGEPQRVLRPVTAFINELGTQKHTIQETDPETGEVKEVEYELGHEEIMKDYEYRISKALQDKNFREAYERKKAYKKWLRENMELPYTEDYYKLEDHWEDEIGRAAFIEREKIEEDILDILTDAGGELELSDEQVLEVERLKYNKRRLASIYDDNQELKTGLDYDIAIRIQEYNKDFAEIHNFNSNIDLFNHKKNLVLRQIRTKYQQQGIDMPADQTPEYFDWLSKNEVTVHTDKFYNRYGKLKTAKLLAHWRAAYHYAVAPTAETKAIDNFLNSRNHYDDVTYVKEAEKLVESLGMSFDSMNTFVNDQKIFGSFIQSKRDRIQELLKPYKEGGKVNHDILPREVTLQVKQLEMEIHQMQEKGVNFDNLTKEEKDTYFRIKEAVEPYQEDINDFITFNNTSEYYKAKAEAKLEAEEKGIPFEKSKWFQDNHVYKYDFNTGQSTLQPISIWTTMEYSGASGRKYTAEYRKAKAEVIKSSIEVNPSQDAAFHEEVFEKSDFYKEHHDDKTGDLKPESAYFVKPEEDDVYIKKTPNSRFNRPEVKEEYRVLEEGAPLKPRPEKFINKNYTEKLAKNPVWKEALPQFMKFYQDAQAVLPEHYQMGHVLPFVQKGWKETLVGKQGWKEKGKTSLKLAKEQFYSSNFDVVDTGDPTTSAESFDDKYIPMAFTKDYYAPQDEISKDVFSTIMKFMASAYKHEALNDVMAETRTMMSLISDRTKVQKDAAGRSYLNSLAKNLGIDRKIEDNENVKANDLIREFIEMQILGQLNIVHEINPFGKTIRVDKVAGKVMGFAAWTQIGGITNTPALLKGIANSLQAEIQVKIEQAAGQYFHKSEWKQATKHWDRLQGWKSMVEDLNKVAPTTLVGQMFSIYDPMQGEFLDKYGNPIAGNMATKFFSSGTWFFNQHAGEFNVAMRSMFALLHNRKIDKNGDVWSKAEWMQKEKAAAEAAGTKWDNNARNQAEISFRGLSRSLRDAYEVDPTTKKLRIKEGVNWEIGSKRDTDMRDELHAINKDLHGNYNNFDKPALQRHWWGSALMMYRKYLAPALRRRFGQLRKDQELGNLRYGYYRSTIKLLVTDARSILEELKARWNGERGPLSELEYANLVRALIESAIVLSLMLTVAALAPGDDEDKNQISEARWMGLYLSERLRKEMMALWISPFHLVSDNYKTIRNPSAAFGTIDKTLSLVGQMSDPFETYKSKSGRAEKGDSKLYWKAMKLKNQLAFGEGVYDARTMYQNLNIDK